MSAAVRIERLTNAQRERWDTFVNTSPDATFFHRAGWSQVIERAFGHRTHYLYAEENGAIAGVLPLVELRSVLFGNALVSTPFCVYGGVVAASESARRELTESACALARELAVGYLELRHRTPQNPEWPTKQLYVTFRKPIDASTHPQIEKRSTEPSSAATAGIAFASTKKPRLAFTRPC